MALRTSPEERDLGLCVIVGGEKNPAGVVRAALKGGARFIQYRGKGKTSAVQLREARELRAITRKHGATLVINDRPDIALLSGADGVHLGTADLPLPAVRRMLGAGILIGATAHTSEEGKAAEADGADYLGFGAVFPSATKAGVAVVGLDRLESFVRGSSLPVLGIGGISENNVADVCRRGAAGVAVLSAVTAAADPAAASRNLVRRMEEAVSSGPQASGS
ncbi:MAG: thiamine phosphate synthase [Deltaproteobacteria bacterium]|nr:thiamine phosphate synthase [Deltaproteobacteria bacterium]